MKPVRIGWETQYFIDCRRFKIASNNTHSLNKYKPFVSSRINTKQTIGARHHDCTKYGVKGRVFGLLSNCWMEFFSLNKRCYASILPDKTEWRSYHQRILSTKWKSDLENHCGTPELVVWWRVFHKEKFWSLNSDLLSATISLQHSREQNLGLLMINSLQSNHDLICANTWNDERSARKCRWQLFITHFLHY